MLYAVLCMYFDKIHWVEFRVMLHASYPSARLFKFIESFLVLFFIMLLQGLSFFLNFVSRLSKKQRLRSPRKKRCVKLVFVGCANLEKIQKIELI